MKKTNLPQQKGLTRKEVICESGVTVKQKKKTTICSKNVIQLKDIVKGLYYIFEMMERKQGRFGTDTQSIESKLGKFDKKRKLFEDKFDKVEKLMGDGIDKIKTRQNKMKKLLDKMYKCSHKHSKHHKHSDNHKDKEHNNTKPRKEKL